MDPKGRSSVQFLRVTAVVVGLLLKGAIAQTTTTSDSEAMRQSLSDLQQQIRELQSAVKEIRAESAEYRAQTQELRAELSATRAEMAGHVGEPSAPMESAMQQNPRTDIAIAQPPASGADSRLARLEEQYELLTGKVNDQYQTKVESASKYRVRLSGIVLLNLFSNHGSVDNIDFPSLAVQAPPGQSNNTFGATMRQSQLGLEVFGPHLGEARTSADLQLDFAGGFPQTPYGVSTGLLRMRTATMHVDWKNTSIVGGQDALFFTPENPTSFASLATPALGYAGNLWNWVPQVRVEHRMQLSDESRLTFQGGILDSVTGEPQTYPPYRYPEAGEASGQPAYAGRAAWTHTVLGQPLTIAAAGYFARQDYGFGRVVNGWAGMSDWDLPLTRHLALSGKFYRGAAIGGLGGGIGRSVIFSDTPTTPTSVVEPLNAIGGWAQLRARVNPRLEFNAAFGQDNSFASDIRRYPYSQAYQDPTLTRNRGMFGNVIFRPRSDLLFSAEYRQLQTYTISNDRYNAGQLNLVMGVLF